MTTCSPTHGLCEVLQELIEFNDNKSGFHVWRKATGGRVVTKGVVYKSRNKARFPTLLNCCPFCEADLKWNKDE